MKLLPFGIALALLSHTAYGLNVVAPAVETAKITIHSPDEDVATLGKVDFIIDLAAEHDSLFELKIRRAELKLKDGRKSSAFGYSQDAGIIVVGAAPITHITVTGSKEKNVFVIFYNAKNEVIAPRSKDIRAFDLDFKPIKFKYEPAQPPGTISINVSVLLDHSGSMTGNMTTVMDATRTFLNILPKFAKCSLYAFSSQVDHLGGGTKPCPDSLDALATPIPAEGATALYAALDTAMRDHPTQTGGAPHLVIVVTDGGDTQGVSGGLPGLIALKAQSNAKVLVFWAGSSFPQALAGLADFETSSTSAIKSDLDAFFHSIGVSVSGLQTLELI